MTEETINANMTLLMGWLKARDAKYRRNYNRYVSNGRRRESVYNQYGNPLAYFYSATDEDLGVQPSLNVLRSCVDTLISKLSQTKVRPFFNPINGNFYTRKVCRLAQNYFDVWFDKESIYKKAIMALRDAMIFEYGTLWIDDETASVRRVGPWDFYYDPAEFNFGRLTHCLLYRDQYPLIYLQDKIAKFPDLKALLDNNRTQKITHKLYWDLKGKKKYEFANQTLIAETETEYDMAPFVMVWYSPVIKGGFSTSLIDNSITTQMQIDSLTTRIHDALEVTPFNTVFVPKGSLAEVKKLTNQAGLMVEYVPMGTGTPVTVSTPSPISGEYQSLLQFFEEKIYNMEGISQLSSQSKKPADIESGVALQTLEDVESDRFNELLQNYMKFLMDIAKRAIDVYPNNADVLPKKFGRGDLKWKDIRRERDVYDIQFSSASSLSKDPAVKMGQIEKLISMKLIDPSLASKYLEMPDLDSVYSVGTASYDDVQRIIERAVEDGNTDFYEVVNLNQLYTETVSALLRFDANDEKPEILERLKMLLGVVKKKIDAVTNASKPPAPPPAPQTPMQPVNAPPVQGQDLPMEAPQQANPQGQPQQNLPPAQ